MKMADGNGNEVNSADENENYKSVIKVRFPIDGEMIPCK
jgi:hypothetical protein